MFEVEESALPRDELADRVFAGRLVVLRGLPAMAGLVALARERIEAALGPDPETALDALGLDELKSRAAALRRGFEQDEEVRAAFRELFSEIGFSPETSFSDRRVLRLVPPGPRLDARPLRSLPPHRDTWGSNVAAQINLWAPVYPLTAERTLLLFPGYWDCPIANTTPQWNLDDLFAARARGESYPQLPVATEAPPPDSAVPCLIEPGELLCFSGAQLHASAQNTSGRIRFSLETRVVALADLEAGRGAPNVDGHPGVVAYRWFSRVGDDAGLESVIGGAETALGQGGQE